MLVSASARRAHRARQLRSRAGGRLACALPPMSQDKLRPVCLSPGPPPQPARPARLNGASRSSPSWPSARPVGLAQAHSQDLCVLAGTRPATFFPFSAMRSLARARPDRGRRRRQCLGEHRGAHSYTVGQRPLAWASGAGTSFDVLETTHAPTPSPSDRTALSRCWPRACRARADPASSRRVRPTRACGASHVLRFAFRLAHDLTRAPRVARSI